MVTAPLFVPATRPDRFAKALASGTDAVILDLEDAVAAGDKETARTNLAHLPEGRFVTTGLEAGRAAEDAAHARALGMGGKLCIHPMQLAEVRLAFTPSPEELDWALAVLQSGDGVARVSGEMVDEPVRRKARGILERAGRSAETGSLESGRTS